MNMTNRAQNAPECTSQNQCFQNSPDPLASFTLPPLTFTKNNFAPSCQNVWMKHCTLSL